LRRTAFRPKPLPEAPHVGSNAPPCSFFGDPTFLNPPSSFSGGKISSLCASRDFFFTCVRSSSHPPISPPLSPKIDPPPCEESARRSFRISRFSPVSERSFPPPFSGLGETAPGQKPTPFPSRFSSHPDAGKLATPSPPLGRRLLQTRKRTPPPPRLAVFFPPKRERKALKGTLVLPRQNPGPVWEKQFFLTCAKDSQSFFHYLSPL